MISFRYHLVTVVAVFLALGLGLLAGSSFGQPALVGQLRDRTDAQLERIDALRAEAEALDARNAALEAFAAASAPYLVDGRLEGYRVVVITQEGVDPTTESVALDALERSGASLLLTVALQPALVSAEPVDVTALVAAAGTDDVASALAARLAAPSAPAAETDVLTRLVDAGLLATRDAGLDEDTRMAVHAGDLLVVVLGGAAAAEDPLATRTLAIDLVGDLAALGVPVAAGEGAEPADPWVGEVVGDAVVAVVGLDDAPGGAALVLGLRDRLLTGRGGAYGAPSAPLP